MKKTSIILCLGVALGFSISVPAASWDDGEPANHNWSSPLNWSGDALPANGETADIATSQSVAPNHPVLQTGIQPAGGYLTHVIVGNSSTGTGINPKLEINGGELNVEWLNICWDAPPSATSRVEMTDGVIDLTHGAGHFALGISGGTYGATAGPAYFTQSGGTVNALVAIFGWGNSYAEANLLGGVFNISSYMHMWPAGRLNIDGGTLNVQTGAGFNLNGIINITTGEFILDGDQTAFVTGWVTNGIIIADGGSGQVGYDCNGINPGKTTVWNISQPTLALWRFEEGADGIAHAGDQDGFYQDGSGNGNHLSSWHPGARPTATSDVPFSMIPLTGEANGLALGFVPAQDICTFGSTVGKKMIESYMFDNGWTVECTIKPDNMTFWQVVVGKDGARSDLFTTGAEPPFALKICGDPYWNEYKMLSLQFVDDTGGVHATWSIEPLEEGKWYSVAATYDGTTARLYIKGENDTDYVLQSSLNVTAGVALGQWNSSWCVGRGAWGGGAADFFSGIIDEVRISNEALDPADFLNNDGDADNNGMADTWEVQNLGSTGSDPYDDSDLDGLDDFTEYVFGGNPNTNDAAAIYPSFEWLPNGDLEYVFNRRLDATERGLVYDLFWKTNLLEAGWFASGGIWQTNTGFFNAEAEVVSNHVPTSVYGLPQAFVQLQVEDTWLNPVFGRPANPSPADGDDTATDDGLLSWDAVPGATEYNVYFGTNETAVANGAADMYIVTTAGFDASSLVEMYGEYFWRVVPVADGLDILLDSPVWSFKATIPTSLGRGHRICVKRGILMGAVVFPGSWGTLSYGAGTNIDWNVWSDCNLNLANIHRTPFTAFPHPSTRPLDTSYIRWAQEDPDLAASLQAYIDGTGSTYLSPAEENCIGGIENLAAMQAFDETDLDPQATRNGFKAAFDRWKAAYPDTLCYTTQNNSDTSDMMGYQRFCRPDIVVSFNYPVFGDPDDEQWTFWKELTEIREYAARGIGSSDYTEPIPMGWYYEAYHHPSEGHQLSGSELTLMQFAPVAFGCKVNMAWCYAADGGANLDAVIFDGLGDQNPNALYDTMAENNRQIRLMGDSLVRLESINIWEIGDVDDDDGFFWDDDNNIPSYSSGNVPNITGVSFATGRGGIISRFDPLHEDFDGPSYSNQVYFMVVNGNFSSSGTPSAQAADVTLTIGGGITALESVNLTTGAVETLPVTSGTVTFNLDGGRGKLFKFQTGAPFVGFYDGE